jgi:hypothetical protein
MDTSEILELPFNTAIERNFHVTHTLLKQGVAQLAAIRGILEVEQAHMIALRRRAQPQRENAKGAAEPWPPTQADPLGHLG